MVTFNEEHISKVKVIVHTNLKFITVPIACTSYFYIVICIQTVFHQVVVSYVKARHDLEPVSYLEGQDHSVHKLKNNDLANYVLMVSFIQTIFLASCCLIVTKGMPRP